MLPQDQQVSAHDLMGRGCSSVDKSIGPARRCRRFDPPVWNGIFLRQSTFSAHFLSVSVHLRVQSHALTSVPTLKILLSMSEIGGL